MANVRLKTLNGVDDSFMIIDTSLTAVVNDRLIARKGGITVTLPAATLFGSKVIVKNVGSSALTVSRAGTDKIGSGVEFSIPANKTYSFEVMSSGNWWLKNITAVDNLVARKMDDSIVYVNLAEGVSPLVQTTQNLK